jgi:hypothetical protein
MPEFLHQSAAAWGRSIFTATIPEMNGIIGIICTAKVLLQFQFIYLSIFCEAYLSYTSGVS